MTAPLVRLEAAAVRFGDFTALRGIDLQVHAGEQLALIGANGSGKSTLLRLLHGLIAPSEGALWRRSGLREAMVFQRPLMLRASAQSNVALGLWLHGMRWREARATALPALAGVGLRAEAARPARALSGGQQQRLAIARALGLAPELMFLDEPTASLDPHAKREVESLMADFAARRMTLVFASHNLGQVKRLATRVVYLEQGRVLADLPVDRFFDRALLPIVSRDADLFVKGETP